ncbi:MAG: DUF512 domain-containing protein [Candidatus Marinimicrobia bacterium]|nr:DUF512 domain-containing protein [Candidatus Neomarinimicrobiota bacterium]
MKIIAIEPNSTGAELELQPGDNLKAIDGKKVRDIIDYRFRITAEEVVLRIDRGDEVIEYNLEKEYDDDLGLSFEDLKIRKCANDCIFCFVDQNPKGMRAALYFRDGDYRLSFLHGHFVTLTNMGKQELQRVVEQRMTPLYISVHVTDPAKRKEMFLYGKDDKLLDKLEYLTSNGIDLHTQIVLCPGWNDGEFLERTVADLHRFLPGILSLAIVPVGLTKHRDGLPFIPAVDEAYAREFIPLAYDLDQLYRDPEGERLVFLSDEWFIRAGVKLPDSGYYGDFSQVENGVGQVRYFFNQWSDEIRQVDTYLRRPIRITIGSGRLIEPIFRDQFIPELNLIENLTVEYIPIVNKFYGDSVQVTGLLTGQDIVAQLKDRDLGKMVIFSERILSETGVVTLDDLDLVTMSDQLGVPVKVVGDSPVEFFEVLRNG